MTTLRRIVLTETRETDTQGERLWEKEIKDYRRPWKCRPVAPANINMDLILTFPS